MAMGMNEFIRIDKNEEKYPEIQWTFAVQANPVARNLEHIEHIEIEILYMECQWKPHISIIFHVYLVNKMYNTERLNDVHTLLTPSQVMAQGAGTQGVL